MSEPGTAAMVAWVALLHDTPPGHPVGGSGGLTQALRRRLEADGGHVTLGDGAARLLVESGRVTGVEMTSGRRIAAPAVVAACHVLATRDLAGDHAPPRPLVSERSGATSSAPSKAMSSRGASSSESTSMF